MSYGISSESLVKWLHDCCKPEKRETLKELVQKYLCIPDGSEVSKKRQYTAGLFKQGEKLCM